MAGEPNNAQHTTRTEHIAQRANQICRFVGVSLSDVQKKSQEQRDGLTLKNYVMR